MILSLLLEFDCEIFLYENVCLKIDLLLTFSHLSFNSEQKIYL